MLSKKQLSFLRSLHQKKFRQMYGKFLVEGDKLVRELLDSKFKIDSVYALKDYHFPDKFKSTSIHEVTPAELAKIATHESPNQAIAVAHIPTEASSAALVFDNELIIACDHLNDPGNAGAIIRIAEWFGVSQVFFSQNSVDIFNPKVVNAAKGSLFRIRCQYADLKTLFTNNPQSKVYGTFMNGVNIYTTTLPSQNVVILIGSEASGISNDLLPFIHHRVSIPSFGKAESLNAAVATGIVLSEFRRRSF